MLLAIGAPACAAAKAQGRPSAASGAADGRLAILGAMESELARSRKGLSMPGYESPYFVAYTLKDLGSRVLTARFGAITSDDYGRKRNLRVEVRVGAYEQDNGGVDGADYERVHTWEASDEAPLDDSPEAVRGALWLLTDQAYKEALAAFLKKKAQGVFNVDDHEDVPSFSQEEPARHVDPRGARPVDTEASRALARRLSTRLIGDGRLFDSQVRLGADHQVRYFVSTEGTSILTERTLYSVSFSAVARAPDGMLLDASRTWYAPTPDGLPPEAKLNEELDTMVTDLLALRDAPVLDPYNGPAILAPEATGVLFHEAVGHRLEGARQSDEHEGRTFKGQVGQKVLPDFLTVLDDPTRERFDDIALNGHYRFDDEGVPAQSVTLVEDGVLRGFLLGRQPIEGFARSNGHGRAQGVATPTSRMGSLIVQGKGGMSAEGLKARLLEEVQRQGKPYGLYIRDITGGSTNTSNYGYQAFKGNPRMVYKVDATTGQETLVRGVEVVGTPLTTINRIVAVGDRYEVFNGFCGAESGYVPVSTVAPAALLSELELQRDRREKEKPPLLPPPWALEAAAAAQR